MSYKRILILLPLLLATGAWPGEFHDFLQADGFTSGTEYSTSREIVPGVEHRFISTGGDDPLTINVIIADLASDDITVEVESGLDTINGREKLDKLVARENASGETPGRIIAATNADFWGKDGLPVNLFVDDGTIWKGPFVRDGKTRSALMIGEDESIAIGQPEWKAQLSWYDYSALFSYEPDKSKEDGVELERKFKRLDYVNSQGEADSADNPAYLFTPQGADLLNKFDGDGYYFHPLIPWDGVQRENIYLMRLSDKFLPNTDFPVEMLGISTSKEEAQKVLMSGAYVIAHREKMDKKLAWGGYNLDISLENVSSPAMGIVGGVPQLLDDGEIVVKQQSKAESIRESFGTARHPRTAVGIGEDGTTLYMITVDGRQPGRAVGISLYDLAEYMKELGAWDAMNFDGGGSTTMLACDEIVNFPSDITGPRPVTNALLIRWTGDEEAICNK